MFVIPVFLLAVSLSISLAKISRTKSSERARISDRASDRTRWAEIRGWMLLVGAGQFRRGLGSRQPEPALTDVRRALSVLA